MADKANKLAGMLEIILGRRSVRAYDETKEIDDATVESLLRAAMAAPSAMNLQPWEFVVVRDKATLARLAATNPYGGMIAKASVAIVVCGDTLKGRNGGKSEWWEVDCAAATENLLLACEAAGLGAVWTAVHPHEDRVAPVREILAIPEHVTPLCIVPAGYPRGDAPKEPKDKWDPSKIRYGSWRGQTPFQSADAHSGVA